MRKGEKDERSKKWEREGGGWGGVCFVGRGVREEKERWEKKRNRKKKIAVKKTSNMWKLEMIL